MIQVIATMSEDEHFTRDQMWAEHKAIFERFPMVGNLPKSAERDAELAALHHKEYSQYVTPEMIRIVWQEFGPELVTSTDRHFNDVGPINRWDRLWCPVRAPKSRRSWSPSDQVCILKTAARLALAAQA